MVDDNRDGSDPIEYPQQELLPQDVRPGRNRTPLIVGLVAGLVLAAAVGGAYLLLRDDGEDTRAAYCESLRDLSAGGDLSAAAEAMGPNITEQLQQLIDDAPKSVADDWQKLRALAESTGDPNEPEVTLDVLEPLQAILSDAKNNCDLPIEIPGLEGL